MYLDEPVKRLVEGWLDHLTTVNRETLREFFDFTDRIPHDVNAQVLQTYVDRLERSGVMRAEITRRVMRIKKFLGWCIGQDLIDTGPLKDVLKPASVT